MTPGDNPDGIIISRTTTQLKQLEANPLPHPTWPTQIVNVLLERKVKCTTKTNAKQFLKQEENEFL